MHLFVYIINIHFSDVAHIVFNFTVDIQLYSPNRPAIDPAVAVLWLMAVGTVVCASLWDEYVACEQVDERYNELTRKVFFQLIRFYFFPEIK